MLQQLQQSHDNIIGYELSGDLTEQEVEQAASELRDAIARHGKIRLLYRLTDYSLSAFFTALGERLQFVSEHSDDIDRVAIVTDDKATELLSKITGGLSGMTVERFARDDEDTAWAWLE